MKRLCSLPIFALAVASVAFSQWLETTVPLPDSSRIRR